MKVFLVQPVTKGGDYVFRDVDPVMRRDVWDAWHFDGTPKGEVWKRIDWKVDLLGGKRKRIGDFLACTPGSAIAMVDLLDSEAARIIRKCGELLPVSGPPNVPPISIINIAPTVDALDADSSQGFRYPGMRAIALERAVFKPSALPRRSLFKVPESTSLIFAVQGTVARRNDFKAIVEDNGYTGLEFREMWNDDGDPVETIKFSTEISRTTPGLSRRT